MEKVDLSRYQLTGLLGTGADYEVRGATDLETGQSVVLKRPVPQVISRQMHGPIEARTERSLQIYQELGPRVPQLAPILAYTEPANHDDYYGDSMGHEYRVMVMARAQGIPLVGDVRARIMGVPIGLGQNLFALFPLSQPPDQEPFTVLQQLLDLEEQFYQAGHILLDLGPQNVYYQPASGRITVIDSGDLLSVGEQPSSRSRRPRDIHDFYLEMLKFYTTSQEPPPQAGAYRDPYRMRPVISLEQELDEMARGFLGVPGPVGNTAGQVISKVRERSYTSFEDFRRDLTAYLEEVKIRNQNLPNLPAARQAWSEALELLRGDHWQKYLFDPEVELASLNNFS